VSAVRGTEERGSWTAARGQWQHQEAASKRAEQRGKQRCLSKGLTSGTGGGWAFRINLAVGVPGFGLLTAVLDLP